MPFGYGPLAMHMPSNGNRAAAVTIMMLKLFSGTSPNRLFPGKQIHSNLTTMFCKSGNWYTVLADMSF